MTNANVQSRKICFVEAENDDADFFAGALTEHDVLFGDKLEDVPADTEVMSVFINERIGEAFLASHPALKLICTRSSGYDHIDLKACAKHGVMATNVVAFGENTVAEHTFALMLALSRRLRDSYQAIRTGHFSRTQLQGFDLRGRTLGVIGAGRIGRRVIQLGLAFGMKVIAYEPHPRADEEPPCEFVPFEELLRQSHFITLHLPLNDATQNLLDRETLALCRDGVFIINTARGLLINTHDVIAALEEGKVAGLALDVMDDERIFQGGLSPVLGEEIAERVRNTRIHSPGPEPSSARLEEFSRLVSNSALLNRHDVILTPHVAYNSVEANEQLRRVTTENIVSYLEGNPLKHLCA